MGFEKVVLFGAIDVELEATAGGLLTLSTDLPGNAMATRETRGIVATGRRVIRYRLQNTTKGHLYALRIAPYFGSNIRLYGARVWARVLPGTTWDWYTVPIPQDSDWQPVKLDIPPVGEWQMQKLDIPPVGEWQAQKLDIPPVSDWQAAKLPIKPTPQNPEWIDIQVDQ